jgi:hypothetical protein
MCVNDEEQRKEQCKKISQKLEAGWPRFACQADTNPSDSSLLQ